jgi:hypothetical protein
VVTSLDSAGDGEYDFAVSVSEISTLGLGLGFYSDPLFTTGPYAKRCRHQGAEAHQLERQAETAIV